MSVTLEHVAMPRYVVESSDGAVVLVKTDIETLVPLSPTGYRRIRESEEWQPFSGPEDLATALEALVAEPPDEAMAIELSGDVQRLPMTTLPTGQVVIRTSDVFRKPKTDLRLPLNNKTTFNRIDPAVPLAEVEPVQDFIPVAGLEKYVEKPRKDSPDVARIACYDGRVRWVMQEGHTRTAAALLRGEQTMAMRVWEFTQTVAATYEPVPRGRHRRGLEKSFSYREKLVVMLGDRSKYPDGKYPNEQERGGEELESGKVEYGPSGKPLPEWRIRRREEKARAAGDKPQRREREREPQSEPRESFETRLAKAPDMKLNDKKVERAINEAGATCLREGGRYEVLRLIGPDGSVMGKSVGSQHRVKIVGPAAEALHRHGSNLTVVHNHPVETSLSPTDYRTSALPGVKEVVAVTNDGSIYRGKGFERDIGPLWKGKFDAVHEAARAVGGGNGRYLAEKFAAHLVNETLAKAGHVTYDATFGRETAKVYRQHKDVIEKLRSAAEGGGRRVRERRRRFEFAVQQDVEWLIDPPPYYSPPDVWWDFIDEMDEEDVPEDLWVDMVPDDLAPRTIELGDRSINLPDIADVSFPSMVGAIPAKPRKRKKRVNYRGVLLSRWPTPFEEAVLSLTSIPARFDQEIERTVMELAEVRQETLRARQRDWFGGEAVDVKAETLRVLLAAQDRMARYGVVELRQECRRQGLVLAEKAESDRAFDAVAHAPLLTASAVAMADALTTEWVALSSRVDLRVKRAKRAKDRAIALLSEKVVWGLKPAARQLLHEAFGVPRQLHMAAIAKAAVLTDMHLRKVDDDEAEELVDFVIQTAVMDTATCEPCADADGLIFEYGSDEMDEYQPPYVNCLGGDNCRCVQVYVLKTGGSWIVRENTIV